MNTKTELTKDHLESLKHAVELFSDNEFLNNIYNTLFPDENLKDILNAINKKINDKCHQLPSSKVPQNIGLNIHKLVDEYIKTEIDEYEELDKDIKNDLYARLYEFGCWVYNKNM